ncbi:unnamed protein product, partial [marine sediment metagenome]
GLNSPFGILNHRPDCKCNFCRKNRGNKGAIQGYRQVDKIVTSPPFASTDLGTDKQFMQKMLGAQGRNPDGVSFNQYNTALSKGNIGNLPYGEIDKCIFSPPYAEITGTTARDDIRPDRDNYNIGHFKSNKFHGDSEGQVGNLPYGQIDKIVSLDKGQGKGNMSVVYITFFEVDNPIVLLVKTLISSSVFSSLSGRAMPEITIGFNDG